MSLIRSPQTPEGPALRLHLLELFLGHCAAEPGTALELAIEAERWVAESIALDKALPDPMPQPGPVAAEPEKPVAPAPPKPANGFAADDLATRLMEEKRPAACPSPVDPEPEPKPEPEPPPQRGAWTPDRKGELERRWAAGESNPQIAAAMGEKIGTISGMGTKLGLTKKYPRVKGAAPAPVVRPITLPLPPAPPPAAAPERPKTPEAELIARHIAEKGVTREIDFGADQPAVESLRGMGHSVLRHTKGQGAKGWTINGRPVITKELWRFCNSERAQRGLKPIKRDVVAAMIEEG